MDGKDGGGGMDGKDGGGTDGGGAGGTDAAWANAVRLRLPTTETPIRTAAIRERSLISLRLTLKKDLREREGEAIIGEDRVPMARPWKDIGRYGSVGIEFVLTILICSGIGHWWDGRYGHGSGWGLTAGFLIGVSVGFYNLFKTAQGMQRDIERAEAKDPLPPGVRR